MRDDPHGFAGSTTAPPVVDRLFNLLEATGALPTVRSRVLSRPKCFSCGASDQLTAWIGGQRSCQRCAFRSRAKPCVTCAALVVRPRATGKLVECVPCRIVGRTAARTARCQRCGRDRPLVRRKNDPDSRLCAGCVGLPIVSCSVCGRERPGNNGERSGRARCVNCAATRATCSVCHAPGRTVAARWATGPVCAACRTRLIAQKLVCVGCGQHRRIDPRNTNGLQHCSNCAGLEPFSVCSRCGIEDRIYRNRQCFACLLDVDLDELVARNPALEPFRAVLRASQAPRTVLRWLSGPVVKSMIDVIASGRVSVSHATLDAAGTDQGVAHLRAVLVECGLLAQRDEHSARLEAFIAAKVATITRPEDRKLVDAFATWQVLRRHRQRLARRKRGHCYKEPRNGRRHLHHASNQRVHAHGCFASHQDS